MTGVLRASVSVAGRIVGAIGFRNVDRAFGVPVCLRNVSFVDRCILNTGRKDRNKQDEHQVFHEFSLSFETVFDVTTNGP
jgi:hypothetical protein